MTRSGRRRIGTIVSFVAVAAFLILFGCGPLRRAVRAAAVLREVAAAAEEKDAAPIVTEEVGFGSDAGWTAGTLYRLANADSDSEAGGSPGMVLSHGAAEDGYRDARLVRLASALARAGFVILVPDLEELRALRIDGRSIGRIEGAFLYLRSRRDRIGDERVSLAGISFAGSFSLLAAARDSIRDDVAAVLSFGGYYDLESLVRYWLTAPPPPEEGVYPIASYGRWIALLNHLDDLAPPEDRGALRETLKALLHGKGAPPAPAALSPRGAAIHEAARNTGPLPEPVAEDILAAAREKLSPLTMEGRLFAIRAPVFLLHAAEDALVPESNSLSIRDEIVSGGGEGPSVRLLVSNAFRHVNVGTEGGVGLFGVLREVFFLAAFFGAAGL
jgi:dienelactone hydrolase